MPQPSSNAGTTYAGLFGLGILLWGAVVAPRSSLAAWPDSPYTNLPVCTAAGDQVAPRIVGDGLGGAIIAWTDGRDNSYAIYAQHVTQAGVTDPTWPTDGLPISGAIGGQHGSTVVTDGAGGALVTWAKLLNPGAYKVYVQHLLASGVADPAWPSGGLSVCDSSTYQVLVTMVADTSGGAIVAWMDSREPAGYGIYAQHLTASGTIDPGWPLGGVPVQLGVKYGSHPGTMRDGLGGAIVAWNDSLGQFRARHLLSTGQLDSAWPVGGVIIGTPPDLAWVSDLSGGVLVAWPGNGATYAQHLKNSGAFDSTWPPGGALLAYAAGGELDMVSDGTGGAIVTWVDPRNGGTYDVYAQHVTATGIADPLWPQDGAPLSILSVGDEFNPRTIGDGQGGAIVTWWDWRSGLPDIYAQHVGGSGAADTVWPVNGAPISTADGQQQSPEIVSDGGGGAIITWEDRRDTDWNIYAQRVQATGNLGSFALDAPREGRLSLMLEPPRPNPLRGGQLIMAFTLPSASRAEIDLLDIAGRRIARHEVGSLGPGRHMVDLGSLGRLSQGVYVVRLEQAGKEQRARVVVLD